MEDQNLELKKHILQYGALLGGISVVFGLMLFSLDMHYKPEKNVLIVSLVIALGAIFFAQYSYRKDNEGYLSLSQGIKIGLGMAAIGGIIYILFFLVLSNILDPDMTTKRVDLIMEKVMYENPELAQESLDQIRSSQEFLNSPKIKSQLTMVFSLLIGLIFSLITGLILKRNRQE